MSIAIPDINLGSLAPEIVIAVTGMVALMTQVFSVRTDKNQTAYISLAGILLAGYLVSVSGTDKVVSFSGTWVLDNYSRFFKMIFLLAAGLTVLLSVRYTQEEEVSQGEYNAIILFSTMGLMIMAGGGDLITIYLGLELASICLYILAGITRNRREATESSLKYFLLGSFASGFLLYGMALLYGATGTTELVKIGEVVADANGGSPVLVMGMVLLVVGFGFKIGMVPFHMWAPDVYQGAPTPITAFMSAGPKAAAFAALVRVFIEALGSMTETWSSLLWILAVLTITIGNVIALRQDNVKRMLAYSSVSHAGVILIGLIVAKDQGVSSILFYLLTYTFMNIGAFGVVTLLSGKGDKRTNMEDYKGLWKSNPVLSIAMTLFLLSLAGMPPLGGFVGKFYIFAAAVKAEYYWLAVIGILNSVVAVYYYLRLTVMIYMNEAEEEREPLVVSPAAVVALSIAVYGVIRLGVSPSSYLAFAQQSTLPF